jgi:hypothetical protein
MNNSNKYFKQQGAVMVTVLMLLMVITIMGLSSMKQGIFQARMGTGQVAYNSCFVAAESGLNAIFREFQQTVNGGISINHPDNFMNKATGEAQFHCLGNSGIEARTGSTCTTKLTEFAEIEVSISSRPPDVNNKAEVAHRAGFLNDIDKGGNILIYTDARCELVGMDLAVINTQAWQHKKQTSIGSLAYTD